MLESSRVVGYRAGVAVALFAFASVQAWLQPVRTVAGRTAP